MKQGYPLFRVYRPSKEEIELENFQRPVLEKLSNAGFGVKVADNTYMDIPCRVDSDTLPLEMYCLDNNEPTFVKTFYKWEEIEKFASEIN
ncbi:MAG: hypothetical protein IJN92_10055 [Lachnospiraceae bacterium]|nr:hypothetical protein [Lachnospiraceae bacterium]